MSLEIYFRNWIKLSHYQPILQQSDKLKTLVLVLFHKHPQQIGQLLCIPVSMTTPLNWVSLRDPLKIKNLHAHLLTSLKKHAKKWEGSGIIGVIKISTDREKKNKLIKTNSKRWPSNYDAKSQKELISLLVLF